MTIPDSYRLVLYILMGVLPIWADYFAKSVDYSFRGLMMPLLASASSATAITLAKTSAKMDHPQVIEVQAPVGKPLEVTETAKP